MPPQLMKITESNENWILTDKAGFKYKITSINNFCTEKLKQLVEKTNNTAYVTLEKITEYYSNDYRCALSDSPEPGWRDDDVACLIAPMF